MSEADGVLCSEEYEDEQSPEKIIEPVSYTHLVFAETGRR